MTQFDQYLSAKLPTAKVLAEQARMRRVDHRTALYQAFAEDERAEEARTERSPLVRWARRNNAVQPATQKPSPNGLVPAD